MRLHYLTVLPLLLGLVACAGKTAVESDLGIRGAPDWVNEGSQALDDRDGRLFHGVGQAPPMGDPSLQQSTADNRARAGIARILSAFFDLAADDYLASSAGGEGRVTSETVSREIRERTRVSLSGARIIARWKDPRTGIVYALSELDLDQVKHTLDTADELHADTRRYLGVNADNIFDRLQEEKQ